MSETGIKRGESRKKEEERERGKYGWRCRERDRETMGRKMLA